MGALHLAAAAPEPPDETLAATFAAWRQHQVAQGCGENTVRQRREVVQRLGSWAGADPRFLSRERVLEWLARPVARNTRHVYARHVRSWFGWLVETERILRTPMAGYRLPRQPHGTPHPISEEDLSRALEASRGNMTAWLLLGSFQGLRCLEIAAVRGEDFTQDGLVRVIGKGDTDYLLPVHPLVEELRSGYPRRGLWFPSPTRKGQPVRPLRVSVRISQFLHGLGIDATAHSLRHRFGSEVLRSAQGNVRVAQELLRHASLHSTQIYTQVLPAEQNAALLGLPMPTRGGAS